MKKIVELFGGIGAYTQALKASGKDYNIVDYVELDKHAVNAYNAINGTQFKPTDINNVDTSKYGEIDYLVAGWPCQDYSIAGKGLGLQGNRSNLILLTISKIKEMVIKPKHIILENVKGLLSKKHTEDLKYIKELFSEMGYQWSQALLNSKYFGIPQSRERVFIVLTRNDLPKKSIEHLEKRNSVDKSLKDILDFTEETQSINIGKEQGDKFYFVNNMSQYNGKIIELDINKLNNQVKGAINKVATLGTIEDNKFKDHSFNQKKHFLGIEGVSKTLRAGDCDSENKIIFNKISFNQDSTFIGVEGQANTLVATSADFKGKIMYEDATEIHYRKLNTLECWRLMGFSDEAHNKVKNLMTFTKSGKEKRLISDSQMVKQAGNSIVVNVLQEIIKAI